MFDLDAKQWDRPLLEISSSPHLQLLLALMKVGDWEHALLVLQWMQVVLGVQAANEPAVSAALLAHLKTLLQPAYEALYPLGALGGNVLDKPPYRAVFSGSSSSSAALPPAPGPALNPVVYEVCQALAQVVLPGLSMSPANYALATAVWEVLELLSFPDRAEVYRRALEASTATPCSDAAGLLAVKAFKRLKGRLALPAQEDSRQAVAAYCVAPVLWQLPLVLAAIAAMRKEVIRQYAHLLSKITHATPLQVADSLMWWAKSSPAMVEDLAEIIKVPSTFTMDALTYQVLFSWGKLGKPKMKQDGANEEAWVQGLATLVGCACRAHPLSSFDLSIIFRYLFDGIKAGDALDMILLRCVLAKMTGIDGDLGTTEAIRVSGGSLQSAPVS
eukprot:gene14578-14707_t